MYKLCRTAQSAWRQRELEQGLLRAMLKQHFDEISISELCDDLGVPRKSFYRYFSSKEGALIALLDHTLLEFYNADSVPLIGAVREDLDRFFLFWYDHRDLLEALHRSQLSGFLVQRSTMLAEKEYLMPGFIARWPKQFQHVAICFAVSGLMSMVMQWHQEGFAYTTGEMAKIAVDLLSSPILPEI